MPERSSRLYDAFYAFKDYAAEAARLEALVEAHRRSAGRRLLDVGCGTGRHLAHLRGRWEVEGADRDAGSLAVAAERLPGVRLHHVDMAEMDLGERFDAVCCLFGTIGYARDRDRLGRVVASLARHCVPGGVVVIEPFVTPDAFEAGRPFAQFVNEPGLKAARLHVNRVEGRVAVLEFHYLVADPGGVESFTERHELGLFTRDECEGAVRAAGLDPIEDPRGLGDRPSWIGVRGRAVGG